jgi:hypothetical protein
MTTDYAGATGGIELWIWTSARPCSSMARGGRANMAPSSSRAVRIGSSWKQLREAAAVEFRGGIALIDGCDERERKFHVGSNHTSMTLAWDAKRCFVDRHLYH